MTDQDFSAVVSRILHPVLAPRGFPYAPDQNCVNEPGELARCNPSEVLFHCDGAKAVEEVRQRYPYIDHRTGEEYGTERPTCLDLWVRQERGQRVWIFEGLEQEVLRRSGTPEQVLHDLQGSPLAEWAQQLAAALDGFFTALEEARER